MQILLMSTFPIIVLSGIDALVFSYGKYRQALVINLASSVPRTILYFILVPAFGMTGVATSYTIGSLIGFVVSIIIANKMKMIIFWKRLALTLFIPISIAFILSTLDVNYIVGIIATIMISYLLLMKFHIIEKSDASFLIDLLPGNISEPLLAILLRFRKIIDWFY